MPRRRDDSSPKRYRDDFSEREFEKRVEARRRPANPGTPKRDEKNKAPLLLRVLAWCGVILLCFVIGYVGTNYVLGFLDDQVLLRPEGRVNNLQELQALLSADDESAAPVSAIAGSGIQKAVLSLVYPKDGVLKTENVDIVSLTLEENIREAVHRLLELSGLFEKDIRLLHVFRDADTVYLDFAGSFPAALSRAGARTGTLFITGIVRTLQDNFSPITRVRFLVNSKVATSGAPVDLAATWQLPK